MLLPITLTLGATSALLNLWLASRCGRMRMATKTLHGDGGNALLARRMRAHSNFAEYTPIILILVGLVELALGTALWLWIVSLFYVFGRVAHGFGMDSDKPGGGRMIGTIITLSITFIMALAALFAAYSHTAA